MEDSNAKNILDRMVQAVGAKTDAALAHALGVSPQSLSDARRKSKVPPAWAVTIAQKYPVSLDWLLLDRGPAISEYFDGDYENGEPTADFVERLQTEITILLNKITACKQDAVEYKERTEELIQTQRMLISSQQERIASQEQILRDLRDFYNMQEEDVGARKSAASSASLRTSRIKDPLPPPAGQK